MEKGIKSFIGYNVYKVFHKKMNRYMACLVHIVDKKRKTISWARYTYITNKGQIFDENLVVDHIDGDKTNDSIENLQLITVKENNIKRTKELGLEEKKILFLCPVCGTDFYLTKQRIKNKIQCCSRKCGGKYSHIKK